MRGDAGEASSRRDAGVQATAAWSAETEQVLAFLLASSPSQRQKMFATSKASLKAALRAARQEGCSRCSFTDHVFSIFDTQEARKNQTWTLAPGKLMQLLNPPSAIVSPLQFVWSHEETITLGDTLVQEER